MRTLNSLPSPVRHLRASPAARHPRRGVRVFELLLACLCAHTFSSLPLIACCHVAETSTGTTRTHPTSDSSTLLAATVDAAVTSFPSSASLRSNTSRILAAAREGRAHAQAAAQRESGWHPISSPQCWRAVRWGNRPVRTCRLKNVCGSGMRTGHVARMQRLPVA